MNRFTCHRTINWAFAITGFVLFAALFAAITYWDVNEGRDLYKSLTLNLCSLGFGIAVAACFYIVSNVVAPIQCYCERCKAARATRL